MVAEALEATYEKIFKACAELFLTLAKAYGGLKKDGMGTPLGKIEPVD
jgi:hypothetical protein